MNGLDLARVNDIMDEVTCTMKSFSPTSSQSYYRRRLWCRIMHESCKRSPEWALMKFGLSGSWWTVRRRDDPQGSGGLHCRLTDALANQELVVVRCAGRCHGFGVTGRFVREGDVFALISGVSIPMILRGNERGDYQVVGPALLGGLVKGQLWDDGLRHSLEDIMLV
jgi:hypothetical protein